MKKLRLVIAITTICLIMLSGYMVYAMTPWTHKLTGSVSAQDLGYEVHDTTGDVIATETLDQSISLPFSHSYTVHNLCNTPIKVTPTVSITSGDTVITTPVWSPSTETTISALGEADFTLSFTGTGIAGDFEVTFGFAYVVA